MKSAEQIKGAVKNIAKKMNLKPQEILQIYMFERLVERLSVSKYKGNFTIICLHTRPNSAFYPSLLSAQ